MTDFALLALEGAYGSSVGALTDGFALARDRVENVYAGADHMRMETALRILSRDGAPVALNDGGQVATHTSFDTPGDYAFIWLPAFRIGSLAALEQWITQNQAMLGWLHRQAEQGAVIGASGTSALLLVAAGLTRDVAVPVARALRPVARGLFPRQRIEDRIGLADTGSLLISSGLAHDLALIVRAMERLISPDIARWLTSIMGMDREEENLLATDRLVANAQIWIEQRFTGPFSMETLADAMAASPSTLVRRFQKALGQSPKSYVQQLRLQAAIRMLEKSNRPVETIAEQIGYSDARLFRAMFRQRTGMTASQWRERALAGKAERPK